MRYLSGMFCGFRIKSLAGLAGGILALAGGFCPVLCGSQPAQNAAVAPESQRGAATFQNPIPAAELTFLSDFYGKPAWTILKDKRFISLLKVAIPKLESRYGQEKTIAATLVTLLERDPMPIQIHDDRYVLVASGNNPMLNGGGNGFLWFDLQAGVAIGGIYSPSDKGGFGPELTVFSNQFRGSILSMGQFPIPFQKDLSQWILASRLNAVSTRSFIPEDGRKYPLLHDEDYCAYRQGFPPSPRPQCEDLKAEAAEADMNAAYILARTQNAASATPWVPGLDQGTWIGLREQTCGLGPAGLQCRIRLTRERTQMLIASQLN